MHPTLWTRSVAASTNASAYTKAHSAGYTALVRELSTKAYGDWFAEWLDNKERAIDLTGFVEPRVMFGKR